MFTYKAPRLDIKLNIYAVSVLTTVIYVVTTLPLLIVGFYNWPSADDMSMALESYRCYQRTGSVLATFFNAFRVVVDQYMNWTGYFFSDIMTSYCPSVFGERWYALVSLIMLGMLTFGVCYFFNALFVRALKCDKNLANTAAMLTLTVIVQCMPNGLTRVEAFYWYSGAINYMFMFSMALFWIGLVIRTVCEDDQKPRSRKLFWACFWGFWIGGANYMTALQCAIISVLIIVIFVMCKSGKATIEVDSGEQDRISKEKRTTVNLFWLPAAFNLIGFVMSCLAPGNRVRGAGVEGFGPIKAILISILYTYNLLISEFTRWEVLAAIAIMIVISWKMAGSIRHRFEHPFVFAVFALGMSASNMVPPLFALANIEAGRIRSIVFAEYIVLMMLTLFYVTAWARQMLGTRDTEDSFSVPMSHMILLGVAFIIFGSALCVYDNPHYYSATSAITDLVSGDASTYLKESQERLEVLRDPNVSDAVLLPYSKKPQMLSFDDITEDSEYWINNIMARYYEKNSVVLGGSN